MERQTYRCVLHNHGPAPPAFTPLEGMVLCEGEYISFN